jgi:protein CpxP
MTIKKIVLAAGFIAAAGSLALSTAVADPGFGRPGMRGRMGGAPLFSQLQLSDTQRSQIRDIFANNRDTIRPLMQQLHEKQAALRQSTEGNFDEAAVHAQAQDIASIQAQLIVARAHIRNQVLGVLTDDQKARLSELRAERMQQFREWRQQHAAPSTQS